MKAWKLLLKRGAWCQGYFATTREGIPCHPESAMAEKFCAVGAVKKCYPDPVAQDMIIEKLQLAVPKYYCAVGEWNDARHRRKHEVIRLLQLVEDGTIPRESVRRTRRSHAASPK